MARSARWSIPAATIIGWIASCAPGAPTPTPMPPADRAAQPLAAPTTPAPSAGQPSHAGPSDSEPPSGPRFVPGTIVCQDKLCKSGKEVCCTFTGAVSCAPRVPLGKGAKMDQILEPQIKSCTDATQSPYSVVGVWYCDDSSDCPAGQVCCANSGSGSDTFHSICVPAAHDKSNVCELAESCVDGQPCATANTHCEDGSCVLNDARVRCGSVVCEGATPVCCSFDLDNAPQCTTAAKCQTDPDSRLFPAQNQCSGPSSCPKGMVCQRQVTHTYCSGKPDPLHARPVCETEKDCPSDLCVIRGGKGKPKCVFEVDFSYCACPTLDRSYSPR